jgi:3',5'-cyclic AMP phosphodiesterase CpdA
VKTDRLLFSFVHATDLHYEVCDNPVVPEANARISCLINDLNKLNSEKPLSFVLFSGDLTNFGSVREYELLEAKSVYDSFDIPYYAVAGNHDLNPSREFDAEMYPGKDDYHEGTIYTSSYGRTFGTQGVRFSFAKEGIRFIGVSLRDRDPDGLLDWLEEEIEKTRDQVVISSHYGLYPPRDDGILQTWGFARIKTILPRLREILAGAGNKIIAYLYGHNHINSMVKKDGIYHISSGGIQKDCTGYRLFECYSNRIESSFHLLSDEALWEFNYWGVKKPERCIDSSHRTVEEYHRGNFEEQAYCIERRIASELVNPGASSGADKIS